ncbi:hypothetical protein ACFLVZ_00640 [Chloroflexota bacterium]
MAGRKYPSELNTRTVRVNIDDWHLLKEVSQKAGITVADALRLAIVDGLEPFNQQLEYEAEVKRQAEAKRQAKIARLLGSPGQEVNRVQVKPQNTQLSFNVKVASNIEIKPKGGEING